MWLVLACGPQPFQDARLMLRQVTHTQTVPGPPSRWAGMVASNAGKRCRPRGGRTGSNFTQSRETIGGTGGSPNKRAVLLVFRGSDGRPTSNILAGSSSIPDAVAKLHRYEAFNSTTAPGQSAICIHNVVVSAEIRAEGLTLERLVKSPLAVSTSKFPGGCTLIACDKGVYWPGSLLHRHLDQYPERSHNGRFHFSHRLCQQRDWKGMRF